MVSPRPWVVGKGYEKTIPCQIGLDKSKQCLSKQRAKLKPGTVLAAAAFRTRRHHAPGRRGLRLVWFAALLQRQVCPQARPWHQQLLLLSLPHPLWL